MNALQVPKSLKTAPKAGLEDDLGLGELEVLIYMLPNSSIGLSASLRDFRSTAQGGTTGNRSRLRALSC